MVWVKRLLVALVALMLLAGIALAALVAFVDPNDYKPMLQQTVHDRYERNLAIDGEIRLSLLPRLGLEISGVSLSEPNSTQTFAAMQTARVALAWWPLLSRHLVIEHLSVAGLKANLVRNEAGQFNFHDLLASAPKAVADGAPPVPPPAADDGPALDWNIAGVTIEGGELAVSDAVSGTAFRLERVSAQAKGITLGQPFDFSLNGRVLGQTPRADAALQMQGRITARPELQQYRLANLDLHLDGVLPSAKATALNLRGSFVADLRQAEVVGESLALAFQGDVALTPPLQALDLQLGVPGLRYNWKSGALTVTQAALKAQGRLDGQAVQATLDAPLLQWGTDQPSEPVQVRLERAGHRFVNLHATLEGLQGEAQGLQATRLVVQGDAAVSDERRTYWTFEGQPSWKASSGTALLSGLKGEFRLAGPGLPESGVVLPLEAQFSYAMPEQHLAGEGRVRQGEQAVAWSLRGQQLGLDPHWTIELKSDVFNLEQWWPAPAHSQAPPAGSAAPSGPTAAAADPALWDTAWLADRHLDLDVRVDRLTVGSIAAEQVALALRVADGRAELKQLQAQLFEGTLLASGHAAADQEVALQAQLRNVEVQPLLHTLAGKDALSGRGNLDLDLASRGLRASDLRQALAGKASLSIRDGAVHGINVAQSLREFRHLLGKEQNATEVADAARQTDFTELRALLSVTEGEATVTELALDAPLLRVTQGDPARISLVQNTFDLVVLATVVNTSTGQDGKALEQLRGITIPIRLTGPFQKPQYEILWSAVSSQALKQVLQNEAERQLERLLERQEPDSPGRALGDALKGFLGR